MCALCSEKEEKEKQEVGRIIGAACHGATVREEGRGVRVWRYMMGGGGGGVVACLCGDLGHRYAEYSYCDSTCQNGTSSKPETQ